MRIFVYSILTILCCVLLTSCENVQKPETKPSSEPSHPKLILTANGVEAIKSQLGKISLLDKSLEETKVEVDAEIELGIDVPIPKDYSGGYTHERHKRNFLIMQKAGVLFQILNDKKYAQYIKDMLFAYAKMYPTLPLHPQTRSYARGKLFWQCLNDSNWLVYTSQAYDCIYDWLSKEDRDFLEKDLFKPLADFISIENPQFFNRIHNHSTWGNAAVGMIALVMDDDSLLNRALYGIKDDNIDPNAKDNDGGYIKSKDGKAGFLANLEEPFSPDGYFTEGPYYQRYAMYPFLIFAEALQNKKPDLQIFEFKDSVLIKSVNALINLSNENGDFFPINDAQKGMSYYSRELVTAVDIAYHFGGKNPELLSIAKKQDKVVLDDSGLSVALGIDEGKEKPFVKTSLNLSDGPNGDQGGIAILRKNNFELTFKYTGQGSSHGHYDKLSFSLHEDGDEVIQDYGLARFVNIEQKGGGNYLKENTTWAKQTIAHNTLVQNETSNFNGEFEIGSKYHSEGYIFNVDNSDLQVVSAKENNAYPGTELQRTLVLVNDSIETKPYVLDILKVTSTKANQYDLPIYYLGQLMQTNFEYSTPKTLVPLGISNGYQHLYLEGIGSSSEENMQFNWLLNNKFYTLTSVVSKGDELILTRIGANDPEFNLRRDPGIIIRKKNTKNALFVSVLESHGTYSPVSEFAVNAYSNIEHIEVVLSDPSYTAIKIKTVHDQSKLFVIANVDNNKTKTHRLNINGKEYHWNGPFTFQNFK